MAKGVSIEIEGLDKLIKKLGAVPNALKLEIDAELDQSARGFMTNAAQAAPVDTGFLRNQITFAKLGEMSYEVVSGARYSGFLEWGTITRVRVPAELQAYASQFKGKGLRKTGGIAPHPFFFIQIPKAQADLNKNLNKVIESALK